MAAIIRNLSPAIQIVSKIVAAVKRFLIDPVCYGGEHASYCSRRLQPHSLSSTVTVRLIVTFPSG